MKTKYCFLYLFVAVFFSFNSHAQTYVISTIAGDAAGTGFYGGGYSGNGGLATAAEFYFPWAVTLDDSGNIYVADQWGEAIRKINKSGIISTVAGNGYMNGGTGGYSGDGGPATDAELDNPAGVAVDDSGNIYISDWQNNLIREVNKRSGIISIYAGNVTMLPPNNAGHTGDGGQATAAELSNPYGIALDDSSNLYIAEVGNNDVRKVTAKGIISTLTGGGSFTDWGYTGDGGPATAALLNGDVAVAVDKAGNVYIADTYNNVVRKIGTNDTITTFAGNGYGAGQGNSSGGYSGDGGPATAAEMSNVSGVALDSLGNVYISDFWNYNVRKVNTKGIISTIAGDEIAGYNGDNKPATTAELNHPYGLVVDSAGNVYIADEFNQRIRKLTPTCPALASIYPQDSTICSGQSVILSIINNGITYTWSPSTGLNATTGDSVVATPGVTTTYTVQIGSGACFKDTSVIVKVKLVPPLIVQPQDTSLCGGISVILSVPVSGLGYTWSPSSTLSSSTGNMVVATPVATTIYTVTGSDSLGCSALGFDTVAIKQAVNKPSITDTDNVLTSSATQSNQWYRDSSQINGANNKTYTATDTGCYWSIATNLVNGCSSISDTICLTSLSGINRLLINPNLLSIYPNPTGGDIFINIITSVADVKDWNLQITDVLGRTVYTRQSLNYSNDIDLSNSPSGVYFITVINKTSRALVPMVKQ
jgi:trimeric autotransporter adhesin